MQLDRRFGFIINPQHPSFEGIYCAATLLDPRFSFLLSQTQQAAAEEEIIRWLHVDRQPVAATRSESAVGQIPESAMIPPKRQCLGLNLVESLRVKLLQQRDEPSPVDDSASEELRRFIAAKHLEADASKDPVEDFWKRKKDIYPKLFVVALDIFASPATSAPVERVFSQASHATSGRRGRLEHFALEREVLMRCNKHFL